jgi:hypothetical protein
MRAFAGATATSGYRHLQKHVAFFAFPTHSPIANVTTVSEKTVFVMASAARLHFSQKFFWLATSASLVITTSVICYQIIRGEEAAIEFHGIRFTSEKAENALIDARDQLLMIRTKLIGACKSEDIEAVDDTLSSFDNILTSLGVAEGALKRQKARVESFGSGDYNYNDYTPSKP